MTRKLPYYITGCLSAALFYAFYGFRILNPLYVDWMLTESDPGQHYLGWALFRNSPFKLNPGLTNAVAYPFSTSVIFTDSLPLLAIPCKLIGRFTRVQFQYFGIWALLCVILMGVLTCYLLSGYIRDPVMLVLSSLLVTVSPCMFRRLFWHTSLGAHFLIIIGLILIVYRKKLCDTIRQTVILWALLGFLCCFIHMYFLAMNAALLFAFVCFRIIDMIKGDTGSSSGLSRRGNDILSCILAPLSYLLSSVSSIWLLGGFSSGMSKGAPGLTYYSFNLNGFLNPQGWSSFLPDLPLYTSGQYEGFSYLGAGMLAAAAVSVISFTVRLKDRDHRGKVRADAVSAAPFLICGFIIFNLIILLSASNEVSINGKLIYDIALNERLKELWDIFRACGRLVWPDIYIICLLTVIALSRSFKPGAASVILAFCIILQIFDLSDVIIEKHEKYDKRIVYADRLTDDFINDLTWERDLKHIVFLDKDNLTQDRLYAFAEFAARKKLTINDFYFARNLNHPVDEAALDFALHPSDDTLYVITDESYEMRYLFDLTYYKYGDLSLGLKSPL